MMDVFNSIAGMVEVELTSADPSRALMLISAADIHVFGTQQISDLTFLFRIRRCDFKKLRTLTQKRGESLTVRRRPGLYWTGKRLLKRPVLMGGLLLLLLLAAFLPSRIYFVEVDGNTSIPARLILEAAENCGIGFGASRREVRSEKMKNALLAAIPELQWAGVNTKGCVAVISVREKTTVENTEVERAVSRIVASRDGVIVSCTVERGNALCKVGQAVRAGELLVSGYTDCGLSIRATRSVGEVYAQTQQILEALTPSEYTVQASQTGIEKKYALIVGKKRINFYKDSGILGTTCDKMSTVNYLTLPGGFTLPVALVTEQWVSYDCETRSAADDEAERLLGDFAETYLKQQMVAGRILQKNQEISLQDAAYLLRGRYACLEMIGREQNEEILEDYGEID